MLPLRRLAAVRRFEEWLGWHGSTLPLRQIPKGGGIEQVVTEGVTYLREGFRTHHAGSDPETVVRHRVALVGHTSGAARV